MPNKNYISGYHFELRVKKYLEEKGYYVIRSAGSKSKVDLLAIATWNVQQYNLPTMLLVQCKHNIKISKKEKDGLRNLQTGIIAYDAKCVVAWAKSHGKIIFFAWEKRHPETSFTWEEITWL